MVQAAGLCRGQVSKDNQVFDKGGMGVSFSRGHEG
jgi:hypothetical protein